jgi:hypothetical protein
LTQGSFVPRRDRGQVLTDVAVMLADGGDAIVDTDVLRHQAPLLGRVASAPTVRRTLAGLSSARLAAVDKARFGFAATCGRYSPAGCRLSRVADTDLGSRRSCLMWMPLSW